MRQDMVVPAEGVCDCPPRCQGPLQAEHAPMLGLIIRLDRVPFQWSVRVHERGPAMQALVVPSLEETPEQGAEEAIVEVKVNFDYLLSMPISSLTLEKVRPPFPKCSLHCLVARP